MSDLNKYSPPPQSPELYVAASKHFQQAKMILENIPNPDREVRVDSLDILGERWHPGGRDGTGADSSVSARQPSCQRQDAQVGLPA